MNLKNYNTKNLRPGHEHADPVMPGLYFLVALDGVITLIYRYTDGEYNYGEILGILGDISVQSARALVRRLWPRTCPI